LATTVLQMFLDGERVPEQTTHLVTQSLHGRTNDAGAAA
jgi:hypothetical protein